jgi:hypothetical protein
MDFNVQREMKTYQAYYYLVLPYFSDYRGFFRDLNLVVRRKPRTLQCDISIVDYPYLLNELVRFAEDPFHQGKSSTPG